MNIHIIPAIMPQNYYDIEDSVALVKSDTQYVQLDIMDGKYVSEKTWPFYYGTDRDLETLKGEDQGLPFWEDVDYEFDLMIERPEESLETWLGIGASRIILHYSSVHDWDKIRSIEPGIRNFTKIGCAITIHDDIQNIRTLIDEKLFDFVQVMGIAHIGFQGEPFEPKSLELIRELYANYTDLLITVDGGVSIITIKEMYDAGASQFVSGSGVFATGMAAENINGLYNAIETTE